MIVTALIESHYPSVKDIYLEGIATGNATFQTDAPEWKEWDKGHLPHSRLVAVDNPIVLGWAALTPVSGRCVYAGVAEVSVYISAQHRGKGVGSLLLQELILASEKENIWTLQAGIFPENTASLSLHEKHGFRVVGRREKIGKMGDIWRDTIIMERRSKIAGV